jgi:hypothetical protein
MMIFDNKEMFNIDFNLKSISQWKLTKSVTCVKQLTQLQKPSDCILLISIEWNLSKQKFE